MASPMKHRGKGLAPFNDQPVKTNGPDGNAWHGVPGQRFTAALPPESKGPINKRLKDVPRQPLVNPWTMLKHSMAPPKLSGPRSGHEAPKAD